MTNVEVTKLSFLVEALVAEPDSYEKFIEIMDGPATKYFQPGLEWRQIIDGLVTVFAQMKPTTPNDIPALIERIQPMNNVAANFLRQGLETYKLRRK